MMAPSLVRPGEVFRVICNGTVEVELAGKRYSGVNTVLVRAPAAPGKYTMVVSCGGIRYIKTLIVGR